MVLIKMCAERGNGFYSFFLSFEEDDSKIFDAFAEEFHLVFPSMSSTNSLSVQMQRRGLGRIKISPSSKLEILTTTLP